MSATKLSDAEARQMLRMAKRSLEISFSTSGNTQEFDVVGDTKEYTPGQNPTKEI